MDVFEDVFLGFFNQFENIAVKIMSIDNCRTLRGHKDRTSQLDGFDTEKESCRIEQFSIFDQFKLGQCIFRRVPGKFCTLDKALDFCLGPDRPV